MGQNGDRIGTELQLQSSFVAGGIGIDVSVDRITRVVAMLVMQSVSMYLYTATVFASSAV